MRITKSQCYSVTDLYKVTRVSLSENKFTLQAILAQQAISKTNENLHIMTENKMQLVAYFTHITSGDHN